MSNVEQLTLNPFQENTFIISDEEGNCAIIDPGCYDQHEKEMIRKHIDSNGLLPVKLINTHCHVDHVLGNRFIATEYNLPLIIHREGEKTLSDVAKYTHIYGLSGYEESPEPEEYMDHSDVLKVGSIALEVRYAPGHCPGHIVLVNHKDKYVIGGDVLFQGSIGRTDLPGGDFATLEESIRKQLYTLPDDYKVYCGHGPATTIGDEKAGNPFVRP